MNATTAIVLCQVFIIACGMWCLYQSLRGLKTDRIKYWGRTYERNAQSFWYWYHLIGAGVSGIIFIVMGILFAGIFSKTK